MKTGKTLKEKIVVSLREKIVSGKITPGKRLQEEEVAKEFETSRTPVREAFHQLESEGFLLMRPRRGAVVTQVTSKDVKEFYEIKSLLESYAARVAAQNIRDEDIAKMEEYNTRLKEAYEAQDISEMFIAHNNFHEVFLNCCGNDRLSTLVKSLVNQFKRFRISLCHSEAVEEFIEMHDEIIKAFKTRDPLKVAELVSQNSKQGMETLVTQLAN